MNRCARHRAFASLRFRAFVIRLNYKTSEEPVALWVEHDTGIISFAPWPGVSRPASAFRRVAQIGFWRQPDRSR